MGSRNLIRGALEMCVLVVEKNVRSERPKDSVHTDSTEDRCAAHSHPKTATYGRSVHEKERFAQSRFPCTRRLHSGSSSRSSSSMSWIRFIPRRRVASPLQPSDRQDVQS